ncbi:hypothetical protein [Streptomyces sp. JW3]|uniref:hypothetical protein n=1 Tax=Streptomyces sp. JW3 TaxID=3456955 RepID=UPI003FA45432
MGRSPALPALFAEPPGARLAPAPPQADGGRGLHLVREYADSWGAWSIEEALPSRRGAGKLLWFEVGTSRPVPG